MVFALRGCTITPVLCDMEKYHYSRKWIRQCTFSMGIELSSVRHMITLVMSSRQLIYIYPGSMHVPQIILFVLRD